MSMHRRFTPIISTVVVLVILFASVQPAAAQTESRNNNQSIASQELSPGLAISARFRINSKGEFPVRDRIQTTDRLIIKFKDRSPRFSASLPGQETRRLSIQSGMQIQYLRSMSGEAHVLQLPDRLPADQMQVLIDRLMNLPEVEYVEPDHILHATLVPNDPQYANQWHYYGTWGIDLPAAWDITTGAANIVVAVIDTGITNHADLSGRTVPGYDFVSDPRIANDGDGRDSNPGDPGDWITSAENSSGFFAGCDVSPSSWHGTHVAGTIGAKSNNSVGVAGINWNSKILPVRVLGKCGGYLDDILDGMAWAAGLSVSGVPANPNPAKVLNLSLGGAGACDLVSQSTINSVTAAGAVVVVAAGNDGVDASSSYPADCNGVISVAATDATGSLAGYSNYGSTIKISAPGGGGSSSVLSTINMGSTVPTTDGYAYYQGTSMATPHVSGVVSLMLSLDPTLTPTQVLQIIQSTAKSFPSGSFCAISSSCGSGIIDAGAAVAAIRPQIFADVSQGYWAESYIERLYNAGITNGCSEIPLEYCPHGEVTRDQMAVFLLRGIHGSAYTPPAVGSSTGFTDVPTNYWAAAWIKELAAEGITGGCGGAVYCPANPVSRDQMAVFLLKAEHGSSYVPPAATGLFADVRPSYWAASWIERLAAEGITAGCGGGKYCPTTPVSRDQMAVFLVQTFNLP